jgi:hypothetical protein
MKTDGSVPTGRSGGARAPILETSGLFSASHPLPRRPGARDGGPLEDDVQPVRPSCFRRNDVALLITDGIRPRSRQTRTKSSPQVLDAYV